MKPITMTTTLWWQLNPLGLPEGYTDIELVLACANAAHQYVAEMISHGYSKQQILGPFELSCEANVLTAEEAVLKIADHFYRLTKSKDHALAGGYA